MNMEFHQIGNSNAGSFELFVPISAETLADFNSVPPAVFEWQDFSPVDLKKQIKTKFNSVVTDSVSRFRNLFCTFAPTSVLEFDGAWEFRFSRSETNGDYSCGNNFYLPADQHDIGFEIESFLDAYDINSPEFVEFFNNFYGLSSSSFWHGFPKSFSPISFLDLEVDDDWEESVIIYSVGNGDLLLMNEDQEIGWWYHESNEIGYYANDFVEFLDTYTEFKQQYLDEFGSYTAYDPKKPRTSPNAE